MTPADLVNVLTAITSLIGAVGIVLATVLSWQAKRAVRDVHLLVNSRMTELIESTARASHSEGRQEGVDAAAAEAAERRPLS